MISSPPKQATKFSIVPGSSIERGHKIMIYGASGIGKSSLAKLAPNPVFIGPDDGAQLLENSPSFIPGINSFITLRRALAQQGLFDKFDTIVFDNVTDIERSWALPYTFLKVPLPHKPNPGDSGVDFATVESYGWGKGYRYWYDVMRLLLQDCDNLVQQRKNIIFIAQSQNTKIANPAGEEYLKEGPSLYHSDKVSTLNMFVEWCDHVFRIAYSDTKIEKKRISGGNEHAVYTQPEQYFTAKSRTLSTDFDMVEFKDKNDNSIWKILFGDKK